MSIKLCKFATNSFGLEEMQKGRIKCMLTKN